MSKTPLYKCWVEMRHRCHSPNYHNYRLYGLRGIKVEYKPWRKNFVSFLNWAMSNGYKKGLQIDRIDNEKGYSPYNCRFVTVKVNSRNRRTNHYIQAFGETKTVTEWSEDSRCKVGTITFRRRLQEGWPPERALRTPVVKHIDKWKFRNQEWRIRNVSA